MSSSPHGRSAGLGHVAAFLGLSAFALSASPASADDRADATALLRRYEQELNAGHTAGIVPLYTADGVFMPSGAPTATGSAQLQGAYDAVFGAIRLAVVFTIDELEIHGDIAFARTTSRGQVTVLANGQTQAEENRELFILRRQDNRWLIARYLFNQPRR
ncbi:MAG: DUF4440 domain-containing protein [Lacunisphaera sp.]|nr:DUF4440 domain-containing protein [Lacunisphaera sp.]